MILPSVVAAFVGSGCVSSRVVTDLKPERNVELKAVAGPFYVAGLKYASTIPHAPQNQQADQNMAEIERQLLPLVRHACASRYPALFSDEPGKAIPVGVEVDDTITDTHQSKTLAWLLGTLDICGAIFPCPGQQDDEFAVKTGVWTGDAKLRGAAPQITFHREMHFWLTLFTPLGLITIPGESDFPKTSGTIFDIQGLQNDYCQQIAQQLATVLAKQVTTRDAAYWTAQPLEPYPSVPAAQPLAPPYPYAPASSPTVPAAPAVPLPIPAQTPAPF